MSEELLLIDAADGVASGATAADSAAGVAAAADVVILGGIGAPQVESIVLGEHGLLATLAPGSVIVDCSTSEPGLTRRIAAERGFGDRFMTGLIAARCQASGLPPPVA